MTKNENAPVVADESALKTEANDTTIKPCSIEEFFDDDAELHDVMATLEEHVGFPVLAGALEDWVVDGVAARVEEYPDPDVSLVELRDEAVQKVNAYAGLVRIAAKERIGGGDKSLTGIVNLTPLNAARLALAALPIRSVYPRAEISKAKAAGTVCVYVWDGGEEGIYRDVCEADVDDWAGKLAYAPARKWRNDFRDWLFSTVMQPMYRVAQNDEPHLIWMSDCIFDYRTGEHIPFAPERVSRTKAQAHAPVVGTEPPEPTWTHCHTGETLSLSDVFAQAVGDEETLETVYQTVGAALRPGESWDVIPIFCNAQGSNGKSTVIGAIQALVGEDSWTSSDLETLAGCGRHGTYGLESADGHSLIVCPDSEVGAYVAKSLQLKAIVTHDPVLVEAKFERPRKTVFTSLIICAANELPHMRDKSNALDSRFLLVPFEGRFARNTDAEDKGIRDTFVKQQESIDWLAWKVLIDLAKYYRIHESAAGKCAHDEWRLSNDSVLDFLTRFLPALPSKASPNRRGLYADGLTTVTLYELYKADLKVARPGSQPPSRDVFTRQLYALVDERHEWGWTVPRYDDGNAKMLSSVKHCNFHTVTYRGVWRSNGDFKEDHGLLLGEDIPGFKPVDAFTQGRGRGIVRVYPEGDPAEPDVTDIVCDGTPERPGHTRDSLRHSGRQHA